MFAKLRTCLCSLVIFTCPVMWAGGPATQAVHGKLLILNNEHTLEGDITRVGDQYRVRRNVSETWVASSKALFLCNTREEAYGFLRSRANPDNPDQRCHLAQWCHLHGLHEQALIELGAALSLNPNHSGSLRLLDEVRRPVQTPMISTAPPANPETEPPTHLSPVDLSTEALGIFANRVQPILMNTCYRCHGSDSGRSFHLLRSEPNAVNNQRTMQQNLLAVRAQINWEHLETSPLLTKAITNHGGAGQPPLRGRQSPPYQAIEEWIRLTMPNNSPLKELSPAPLSFDTYLQGDPAVPMILNERMRQPKPGTPQYP